MQGKINIDNNNIQETVPGQWYRGCNPIWKQHGGVLPFRVTEERDLDKLRSTGTITLNIYGVNTDINVEDKAGNKVIKLGYIEIKTAVMIRTLSCYSHAVQLAQALLKQPQPVVKWYHVYTQHRDSPSLKKTTMELKVKFTIGTPHSQAQTHHILEHDNFLASAIADGKTYDYIESSYICLLHSYSNGS